MTGRGEPKLAKWAIGDSASVGLTRIAFAGALPPEEDHVRPLLTMTPKRKENGREEKEKRRALTNWQSQINATSPEAGSDRLGSHFGALFSSSSLP